MPDGTNNYYIDSTFTSTTSTSVDSEVGVRFKESDNIGHIHIPVVFNKTTSISGMKYFQAVYESSTSVSGVNSVYTEYFNVGTVGLSGSIDSRVLYNSGSTYVSGTSNYYVSCLLSAGGVWGERRVYIEFIRGYENIHTDSIYVDYDVGSTAVSGIENYLTNYTNFSGLYDPMWSGIATHDGVRLYTTEISLGEYATMLSGARDQHVDVSFSGWVPNQIYFDVISSVSGTYNYIDSELTVISGAFLHNDIEVTCGISGTKHIRSDMFCCLRDLSYIDYEVAVISGSVDYVDIDLWSTNVNEPYIKCDVDIFPIWFNNFYPEIDEYTQASSNIHIDVHDETHNIVTSGTYFKVDGVAVPVTFSGISDGYTMYYDPADDFNSFTGSTTVTAHAENDNGDVLELDYYLTSGYLVEYINKEPQPIDFGDDNRIVVRMEAENFASCPLITSNGYWFVTENFYNKDLSATIVGVYQEGTSRYDIDLPAEIYPQSLAFFYDKEFTVVLTAKDFSGNELEYDFQFKIENPN